MYSNKAVKQIGLQYNAKLNLKVLSFNWRIWILYHYSTVLLTSPINHNYVIGLKGNQETSIY